MGEYILPLAPRFSERINKNELSNNAAWILAAFFAGFSLGCDSSTTDVPPPSTENAKKTAIQFTDVTQNAGLDQFVHETGAVGDRWFPEAMGAGCGFIDYNGDGWQDILLVGGGRWEPRADSPVPALWLYRNDKNGAFSLVTEEAGLGGIEAYGFGVTCADYDNDGDEDFYFTVLGPDMLFRNDDGVFTEVGEKAGVDGGELWSSSAMFFDADNDGWLDLYAGTYVDWSPATDLFCTLDGKTKSYCTPELYKGLPGRFYRNNGDGTFSDQTEQAGFLPSPGKTLGMVAFDYNRDGWIDVAVANDTQRDLLFENNGDGTFAEKGAMSGLAYDENGRARAGMGIDAGVVDESGEETVFVGHFSKEMIGVFRYAGNGFFAERAAVSKIGRPSLLTLTFGLFLFDVDLDGDLDLFAANGHVQEDIEVTQDGISYREPPHIFVNDGDGQFRDLGMEIGGVFAKNLVGRGAAYADYDNDGDLDILVTENGGPAHLWCNDSETGNNFLRISLRGEGGNRDALGARVVVKTGEQKMERMTRTGSSFLSNFEKTHTFGLGAASKADSVSIFWPDGHVQHLTDLPGGQTHLIERK